MKRRRISVFAQTTSGGVRSFSATTGHLRASQGPIYTAKLTIDVSTVTHRSDDDANNCFPRRKKRRVSFSRRHRCSLFSPQIHSSSLLLLSSHNQSQSNQINHNPISLPYLTTMVPPLGTPPVTMDQQHQRSSTTTTRKRVEWSPNLSSSAPTSPSTAAAASGSTGGGSSSSNMWDSETSK